MKSGRSRPRQIQVVRSIFEEYNLPAMKRLLKHPLVAKHGEKFFRFAVCGGLGACIDFGTLHLLVHYMHWPEKYALIVSTGLAMIFVFIANRFFTFKAQGNGAGQQALKFFMVYLVAAIINYVLSLTFIWIGIHYIIAKAGAIGVVMFFNYFFLNSFVFKKSEQDEVVAA